MTIQDFKVRLQSKIHSGTMNKLSDVNNLIYEAACNVMSRIDPDETIRVIALTLDADSHYYTTPSDLKYHKIITMKERATITVTDGLVPVPTGVAVFNEVPAGTINGSNTVFTLDHTPIAGTLNVFVDGVRLNSATDYSFVATALTVTVAPTSEIIVDYYYA